MRSVFPLLMSATLVRCFVVNTTSELMVPGRNINGTNLFELGNTFNITVLKLIGKALDNMEERFSTSFVNIENSLNTKLCELNPCSQWSKWAKCSAHRVSTFGAQTRTRTCWRGNSKPCTNDGEETIENESRVCVKDIVHRTTLSQLTSIACSLTPLTQIRIRQKTVAKPTEDI